MKRFISPNKQVYSLSNGVSNQMSVEKGLNYKVHK